MNSPEQEARVLLGALQDVRLYRWRNRQRGLTWKELTHRESEHAKAVTECALALMEAELAASGVRV